MIGRKKSDDIIGSIEDWKYNQQLLAGGYGVATGLGSLLQQRNESSQSYCYNLYKFGYPCSPGAGYYGRGAIPLYWNYNYGAAGEGIKADLLNYPVHIEQNAAMAFQSAMWRWMTPIKMGQPSATMP